MMKHPAITSVIGLLCLLFFSLPMRAASPAANSQQITLTLKCWDNWDYDFDKSYGGVMIRERIGQWMRQHTVGGKFNISEDESFIVTYTDVNIHASAQDAQANTLAFAKSLCAYLAKAPCFISTKILSADATTAVIELGTPKQVSKSKSGKTKD